MREGLKNILDLPLISTWYLMIENGDKDEEYRENKPYWRKRFTGFPDPPKMKGQDCNVKGYTHVRFRYGYTKRTMLFEIKSITFGRGNTKLGAPADKDVFIIKLGKRL